MANDNSKVSYFNTLIFTIVSGIISLLLLMLLFFDMGRQNAYLIVTVEIGIFTVIAFCVYQIIKNESLLNSLKKTVSAKISFSECPEYFNKSTSGDDVICWNNYNSTMPGGRTYLVKIYDAATPLPPVLPEQGLEYNTSMLKRDAFKLYEIEQTPAFKDAKQECEYIMSEPVVSAARTPADAEFMNKFVGYSKTPWVHARARCAPYVD